MNKYETSFTGQALTSAHKETTTSTADSSDNDTFPEDDRQDFQPKLTRQQTEDVLGVSLGHKQLYMRSARTPAVEKADAIAQSGGYFGGAFSEEPEETENYKTANVQTGFDEDVQDMEPPADMQDTLRSYTEHSTLPQKQVRAPVKSKAAKEALGEIGRERRRSSIGASSLASALRRLFPLIGVPKNDQNAHVALEIKDGPDAKQTRTSRFCGGEGSIQGTRHDVMRPGNQGTRTDDRHALESPIHGFHDSSGAFQRRASHNPSSPNLRRATSENSLYMRNLSRSTTLNDDTSQWEDVNEQTNSRFKAITDSWQDSRLRNPRLSTINFHPSLSLSSDEASRDAVTNTIGSQESVTTQSRARQTKHLHPAMAKALDELAGDVIVLGGYRGSILRSTKPPNRQLWIPIKVGLNIRKVDLEVGLSDKHEESMAENIYSSGVLSHIGPVDICRRLLRHLKKSRNAKAGLLRIHDYGYDWRLSPHYLAHQFIKFVEGLECNTRDASNASRGVTVIAHSLGGLITRHAVNQRPKLFNGIVYAGTPQHAVNILGPLRNGDVVLASTRTLTAQVNFTIRTSYALLPDTGRCFINKTTGERYNVDFLDPKMWEEYRLSPCINPPFPPAYHPQNHRNSLIGSIADSLQALPGAKNASPKPSPQPTRSVSPRPEMMHGKRDDVKEKARDVADTAKHSGRIVSSPLAGQSLEPTIESSHDPIATRCTLDRDECMDYLARTLANIRTFKRELAFNPNHQASNNYPPVAFIYGKTVPTVVGAYVTSREAIKHSDAYDDLAFAAGDGVVLASAAQLPIGYKCVRGGKIESARGHVGLLGDIEGVGHALLAIIAARKKGCGLGEISVCAKDIHNE